MCRVIIIKLEATDSTIYDDVFLTKEEAEEYVKYYTADNYIRIIYGL